MTRRKTAALCTTLLALMALSACDDDRPLSPGPPVVNPSPSPTPTAQPSPEPSPTAPANRPPTVTVTSGGDCHPRPDQPCTVGFNATASDPDDDRIAYGWDGCAQGNAPFAICTITRPGQFTATVLVTDGQGNFTRASGIAHGTNEAPVVRLGAPPDPAPSNTSFTLVAGQPEDPEEDEDPNRLCTRATVTASGPCRAALALCGGVGDAFDVDVTTLQGPGTCLIEARVADIWGAVGIARVSFTVLP